MLFQNSALYLGLNEVSECTFYDDKLQTTSNKNKYSLSNIINMATAWAAVKKKKNLT